VCESVFRNYLWTVTYDVYVEWCDLGCKQVGLKSFVVSIDYRDYMGSSSKIWALRCLFLYLCSYNWSVLLHIWWEKHNGIQKTKRGRFNKENTILDHRSGVWDCALFGGIEEVPSTIDDCVYVPVQLLGGGTRVSWVAPSVVRKGMSFWNRRAKVKVLIIYSEQG
jgi:hypothetical protein